MAQPPSKGLPPLDWLKVFEAAGRHGSFTAAAAELGTSQAAVSQRIRSLESWLGRQLFIRSARGVALTVDGESYLPLVNDALVALGEATESLFAHGQREVRIAALPSHLDLLLLPGLGDFAKKYPDLRIVLETVPKRSEFDDGDNALHLRYGRGEWPGRTAALLAREVLQPMGRAEISGSWRAHPAIDLRGERPGWRDWARLTGEKEPAAAQLSADSMAQALQAARLGHGIVLGSRPLAQSLLQGGGLCLLPAPELVTADGYWLTWKTGLNRSQRLSPVIRALVRALSETVG
ncbi:LysR family transcriptional regulator [Roseobacteraceae bacterium NS-SX3]